MTGTNLFGSPADDVRPAPLLVRKMKKRLPEVKLDAVLPQICQLPEETPTRAPFESDRHWSVQLIGKQRQRPLFCECGCFGIVARSMIAIESMVRWIDEHLHFRLS